MTLHWIIPNYQKEGDLLYNLKLIQILINCKMFSLMLKIIMLTYK